MFGIPLWQTTGVVEGIVWLLGLARPVSDSGTLCRRPKSLKMSLPFRRGTGDSNSLKVEGEVRCSRRCARQIRKYPSTTAGDL